MVASPLNLFMVNGYICGFRSPYEIRANYTILLYYVRLVSLSVNFVRA